MRKRIYIAGPIVKGDLGQNIERAVDAMFELMEAGYAPFCPHLSCFSGPMLQTFEGEPIVKAEVLPRGVAISHWYETGLAWVAAADAVLRLPGEGKGSDAEVAFAKERGIPVFYSVLTLRAQVKA